MAKTDFLIIGSGIAGLNFALKAAKLGKVLIITKKQTYQSNTHRAQGGIAAVLDQADNFEKHVADTLKAGCFHNNQRAVEFMVQHGPEAIYDLITGGVRFSRKDGNLELTREGGHSMRRIAFVGDYTGQEIELQLRKNVEKNPGIEIREHSMATDLIIKGKTCYGARAIENQKIKNFFARFTVLATGGVANVYKYSTNPEIATGDGIAMAHLAGCKMQDLEFIQFHPTALKINRQRFLISEALRGEGARLVTERGEEFMKKIHPLGDLAPRDIVARAIFEKEKTAPVFLDIRHLSRKILSQRFPKIYGTLLKYGIDMSKNLIPITPAAHYACGGVKTGLYGETGIKNLFAFGEVTCTGVHGANRLASNSLLEALVFSSQILKNRQLKKSLTSAYEIPAHVKREKPIQYQKINPVHRKKLGALKKQIQEIMWQYVGIVRRPEGLKKAKIELETIAATLKTLQKNHEKFFETRNILITAQLITSAALKRKKSLGCHFIEN